MDDCGLLVTSFALTWCLLVVSWRLRQDLTERGDPRVSFRSRVMLAGGMLGWCLWVPLLVTTIPGLSKFGPFFFPLGLLIGFVVGYCAARVIESFVYDDPEESDEDMDDDLE